MSGEQSTLPSPLPSPPLSVCPNFSLFILRCYPPACLPAAGAAYYRVRQEKVSPGIERPPEMFHRSVCLSNLAEYFTRPLSEPRKTSSDGLCTLPSQSGACLLSRKLTECLRLANRYCVPRRDCLTNLIIAPFECSDQPDKMTPIDSIWWLWYTLVLAPLGCFYPSPSLPPRLLITLPHLGRNLSETLLPLTEQQLPARMRQSHSLALRSFVPPFLRYSSERAEITELPRNDDAFRSFLYPAVVLEG